MKPSWVQASSVLRAAPEAFAAGGRYLRTARHMQFAQLWFQVLRRDQALRCWTSGVTGRRAAAEGRMGLSTRGLHRRRAASGRMVVAYCRDC